MNRAIQWTEYPLEFAFTARTSRETMRRRSTFLLRKPSETHTGGWRYGEANFFESLAPESKADFVSQLKAYCNGTIEYDDITSSALRCGIDMLEMPVAETEWTRGQAGIPINGLIWMSDKHSMRHAISEKIDQGFKVLKLKIGGIDFEDEIDLLRSIRTTFSPRELEVRLDANGSFNSGNALERLKRLSDYGIHSIEQPVPAGLLDAMSELCRESPIDIALDEELIGLTPDSCKLHILRDVRPRYIILKPTLCGGIREALKWQSLAAGEGVGWWMTSALESSIGLYYLAAHVSSLKPSMPQGLGTGKIYTNNIGSGMSLSSGMLYGGAPNFDFEFLNTLEWQ